jgi:hypothetical protein
MSSPINELTVRLLAKFPGISFADARSQAEELWQEPAFRISMIWLLSRERTNAPLNPFAAEFLAQAIMRRLGIRTAEDTFLCSAQESHKFSDGFVVKFAKRNQPYYLSWDPTAIPVGTCLVSRIVSNAASIGYVMRKILKGRFGDEPADKLYADFQPSRAELEGIKSAIRISGARYLRICAARLFLGCGCTPHFGNVLVTKSGELVSIDHAHASFSSGEDVRTLFGFVDCDSELFAVLGGVTNLTEKDIRASVDEIPRHPACGSTTGLGKYFSERLQLWKELYASHQNPSGVSQRRTIDEVSILTHL